MPAFSERYEAALYVAARAHHNQTRKGSEAPYLTHVVHVATILQRYGYSDDVVIAGLLHDTVEDSDLTLDEVQAQFGDEVARLVAGVTQPADAATWKERRAAQVYQVDVGGPLVAAVKAADLLHNTRSFALDHSTYGVKMWDIFAQPPRDMLDYYQAMLASIRSWISNHPLCDEATASVNDLERRYRADMGTPTDPAPPETPREE